MNLDQIDAYRDQYRAEHASRFYSGPVHFVVLIGFSLALIVFCLMRLDSVTGWEWLTVPLTFLYANLVEYAAHRYPMHHRYRGLGIVFKRHTLQHHRFFTNRKMQFDSSSDFKAVLFPLPMIIFFTVFFALPAGLLLNWVASANVGLIFVAIAVAYYLNYETLHFCYHTSPSSWLRRVPGMKRLCKLHTTHHDPALMQKYNFNITYPICDRIFGTYYAADIASNKAEAV